MMNYVHLEWKESWLNIDELVACTNFSSSTSLITLMSMICSSLVWDPMVVASIVYN